MPSHEPDAAVLAREAEGLEARPRQSSRILANSLFFAAILAVVLVAIYAMNKGKGAEPNPFTGPPPTSMATSAPTAPSTRPSVEADTERRSDTKADDKAAPESDAKTDARFVREPGAKSDSTADPEPDAKSDAKSQAAMPAGGAALRVTGVVRLASGLSPLRGATLFIILRNAGVPGPPVAVSRVEEPQFPVEFSLGPEDVMMHGAAMGGPFELTARLDRDGNAMTKDPGDLVNAQTRTDLEPAASGVEIVLDKRL